VRRLIINADDFGFTSGVNRAILEAHTRGVVTSSTLMANGGAFNEAVGMARTVSALSVGCHVVLIDGAPVLPAERLSTLLGTNSAQARFRDDLKGFAGRALFGKLSAEQIQAEAEAQIRKIQSAGIKVSHFDSHKHTHLFPQVLRPVLRAARNCGVGALRNPFGPRLPLKSGQLLARPNLWTRLAELRVLRRFAKKFHQSVDAEGFATADGTLGVEVTGTLDENLFRAIAQNVPEGTWEFVCHPGYNDEDLQKARTRLRASREIELNVLTGASARDLLEREGIQLISYHELVHP